MRKTLLALAAVAVLALAAGCGSLPIPGQAAPAATVNGKVISMAAYQRQVALAINYLSQNGIDDKTPDGQATIAQMKDEVLTQMIEQEIINQAAAKQGITVTNDELDMEIAATVADAGGQQVLDDWLKTSGFTIDEFRQTVREQMTADRLIAAIGASVPATADQVRARHILVETKAEADAVMARLQKGEDFAKVAQEVSLDDGSKADGGDLGFFPKGVLIPVFEQVAFSLQPGKYSDPFETEYGFHILQVIERDANHALAPQMLEQAQMEAFSQWLADQKTTGQIQNFVAPEAR